MEFSVDNLYTKRNVIISEEVNLLSIIDVETLEQYISVSDFCRILNLNKSQKDTQIQFLKQDPLLGNHVKLFDAGLFDAYNPTFGIDMRVVSIWLSSINRKSLKDKQYSLLVKFINIFMNLNIFNERLTSDKYLFESHLRDEIYKNGYFDDIKIIDKEVTYDFGRIDLIGMDNKGQKVIIELKKYKDYDDVISQCLKYKNGFKQLNENVRIIICMYDCTGIIEEANICEFECYEYNRELKLHKVNHIENNLLKLYDIANFGLHNYDISKSTITQRQINTYKNKLCKLFDNYRLKLNNALIASEVSMVVKYDIICFYLFICYENNSTEDILYKFDILDNEDDLVELWVIEYFRNIKYPKTIKINSMS